MPAASISRARPRSSAMCVLQIGQSTNRRNCRWTRRLGSGSLIGSPVTDSRVVAGTISPGLNFMFIHSLLFVAPATDIIRGRETRVKKILYRLLQNGYDELTVGAEAWPEH